jgi:hypothetical protein
MAEIYVGPTLPTEGLLQNTVYTGALPANIQALQLESLDVDLLIVPIASAAAALAAINTSGSPEYSAYVRLSNGQIRPTVPKNPSTGADASSVGPIDVTLQDTATATGNGTPYKPSRGTETLTFAITGTSTSRTVIFEMADPSGVYVACYAFNVMDPTKFGTQTTGGNNTAPESWLVDVPTGYSFRARISAVAGGNVMIKGKAVL